MNPPPKLAGRDLLRMREVSERSGLSRQTLNHYLLLGLITEEARTPTGRCLFRSEVLERLAEIETMKPRRTLREIREILGQPAWKAPS